MMQWPEGYFENRGKSKESEKAQAKMYLDLLASHGIHFSPHVSRFTEMLLARLPKLVKGYNEKKCIVVYFSFNDEDTVH